MCVWRCYKYDRGWKESWTQVFKLKSSYKWDFAECELLENVENKKTNDLEGIMKLNNLGLWSSECLFWYKSSMLGSSQYKDRRMPLLYAYLVHQSLYGAIWNFSQVCQKATTWISMSKHWWGSTDIYRYLPILCKVASQTLYFIKAICSYLGKGKHIK